MSNEYHVLDLIEIQNLLLEVNEAEMLIGKFKAMDTLWYELAEKIKDANEWKNKNEITAKAIEAKFNKLKS